MFNSMYQSQNNVFESINLESTISEANNYKDIPATIPESASATSDEELDPTEFITTDDKNIEVDDKKLIQKNIESPNSLKASTIREGEDSKINIKEKLDDQEFFLNPSRILSHQDYSHNGFNSEFDELRVSSIHFPKKEYLTASNENPIEFLLNRIQIIEKELNHNSKNHNVALKTGDKSLNKIRSMIGQNFDQLSETYYPLYELYERELAYTTEFLKGFTQWEYNRSRLLSKIKLVKSEDNKDGRKLMNLLQESDSIDNEILELQKRIDSLNSKKNVIVDEIQSTCSVLESKTSKYIEAFKKIENKGKDAILEFLTSDSNSDLQANYPLKSVPIDLRFSRNYLNNKDVEKSVEKANEINIEQPINKLKETKVETNSKSNIGIVPYEIPESKVEENEDIQYFKDKPIINTNPFNAGFVNGSKLSKKIKSQFDNLVKLLIPQDRKPPRQKNHTIDDINNTIVEKIDAEPLFMIINGRINALQDFVLDSSRKSKMYHEYSKFWMDIVSILKLQESKLAKHISLYQEPCKELEIGLLEILKETANKLEIFIKSQPPLNYVHLRDLLINLILKEAEAINNASKLVQKEKDSPEILNKLENALKMRSKD